MLGVVVGVLMVLLGVGSITAVIVAVSAGLPTLALAIGLISSAFFAGRAV